MSEWYDMADTGQRAAGIDAAHQAVQSGELVVLPTDTVYGIGADAFSPGAVRALLGAKGRGRDMPVPVLIGARQTLDGLVYGVPKVVEDLVEAFWPGGLTIIIRHAASLAWDIGESRGTVGVRMPSHPAALELLSRTGPMAVSSANRTGQPPATTAAQARDQLGDDVAVYLDGGPCTEPVPSTIVDVTGRVVTARRVGSLSLARLREVVPDIVAPPGTEPAAGPGTDESGEDAGDPGPDAGSPTRTGRDGTAPNPATAGDPASTAPTVDPAPETPTAGGR